MSTRTIPNIDSRIDEVKCHIRGTIETIRDTYDEAAATARRLLEEADRTRVQHDRDQADLQIISRLHTQRRDDRLEDLTDDLSDNNDVLRQLNGILNGRPVDPAPAPAVQTEPIAVPPIIPATPIPPTPAPTQVITTPPVEVVVVPRWYYKFLPWNWKSIIAWIFAVIGMFITGSIVGGNWDEAIFESWFSTAIWVGGLGLGFFGGGALGQSLHDWLTPTPNQVVVTRPPQGPTPPPAQ